MLTGNGEGCGPPFPIPLLVYEEPPRQLSPRSLLYHSHLLPTAAPGGWRDPVLPKGAWLRKAQVRVQIPI